MYCCDGDGYGKAEPGRHIVGLQSQENRRLGKTMPSTIGVCPSDTGQKNVFQNDK